MVGVPAWSEPHVAIVTGGGSGLGVAISKRLAAEGAKVAVLDVNAATAAKTAADIVAAGDVAISVQCDVADRESIEAAVAQVRAELGPVTILINNAGITPFEKFREITRESYDRVFAINMRGTFDFCQVVVPDMVEARWGRIVNISSSSAQTGNALNTHYSASKGAVIAFTRSLAKEIGPKGITVNTVPPSFVETPSLHAAIDSGVLGSGIDQHVPATPVRRVGTPDDIAAACAFLTRDDAGYITGQILGVNGGRVIV